MNVARTQQFILYGDLPENQIGVKLYGSNSILAPLNDVITIELKIVPDINGKGRASLRELFIGKTRATKTYLRPLTCHLGVCRT
jgi:hypothetical protein